MSKLSIGEKAINEIKPTEAAYSFWLILISEIVAHRLVTKAQQIIPSIKYKIIIIIIPWIAIFQVLLNV
ncbi:hypothetical protein SKUN_00479 [Spiroplasma kunkelii CR2-3x]|uniref:Uncharacterized protein n=1 Tax=Spiroplasma kunkelii CR2-3x TaxID=273035 RepID=A0A0K2JGM1_SPIKU|nr:hypothetical protein SKUN_00479 [Spiroplasma kunkelii CR2-3x]